MEHFTFGRNEGLRVSALSLGAGMFGSRWGYGLAAQAEPGDSKLIIDRFAEAGGTFIDTAVSYQLGESEENLGCCREGGSSSPSPPSSLSAAWKATGYCRPVTAAVRCCALLKAA